MGRREEDQTALPSLPQLLILPFALRIPFGDYPEN